MAFKIAGSMAFKDASKKADPVLLEPIMKVTVIVTAAYMGDVIGDLNSRRGEIQGFEERTGAKQMCIRDRLCTSLSSTILLTISFTQEARVRIHSLPSSPWAVKLSSAVSVSVRWRFGPLRLTAQLILCLLYTSRCV